MATIDDVSTNDMNLKHLDTTKDIVITPRNEFGGQVLLNPAHTWTAKVSDGNNYIGDYPVKLDSNSIVVNSAEFTNLPAGQYHLEVWEEWIDSNSNKQRSIYPSPQRTIDFTIYQNITDLAEKEIKTIGFQDVVDQAVMNVWDNYVIKVNMIESDQTATVVQSAADGKNYVIFNIPQGSRGYNFWVMKMTAGGNVSGRHITDLYNASNTNLPMVGDSVLQPDGNVYQITGVSNTNDGSNGLCPYNWCKF